MSWTPSCSPTGLRHISTWVTFQNPLGCSNILTGLPARADTRRVHTLLIVSAFCCTGNMRSALNDAAAAKKIKPNHLKALIRGSRSPLAIKKMGMLQKFLNEREQNDCLCVSVGAQCCIELRSYAEAIQWCDEGLKAHPADKKLLEMRASADKHRV